jgi:hypothetical protein
VIKNNAFTNNKIMEKKIVSSLLFLSQIQFCCCFTNMQKKNSHIVRAKLANSKIFSKCASSLGATHFEKAPVQSFSFKFILV